SVRQGSRRSADRAYRREDPAQRDRRAKENGGRKNTQALQAGAQEQGLRRARKAKLRGHGIRGEGGRARLLSARAVATGGGQDGVRDAGRTADANPPVESRLQLYQSDFAARRNDCTAGRGEGENRDVHPRRE